MIACLITIQRSAIQTRKNYKNQSKACKYQMLRFKTKPLDFETNLRVLKTENRSTSTLLLESHLVLQYYFHSDYSYLPQV